MIKVVVIGGGPGGNRAASRAASLGAHVTLVERDIVGGAAHLWDCIPSKAMIATAGALNFSRRMGGLGFSPASRPSEIDYEALRDRIGVVSSRLQSSVEELLTSQGVRILRCEARLAGPRTVVAGADDGTEEELEADAIVVATGSRPRVPDWASPDGDRVLTTRQAYPPPELPEHLVVVGSGVTGVEFVHMFSSIGSKVSLIVSRQHVLPHKDAEVAAALEDELLRRGVKLFKGARAERVEKSSDGIAVHCDDGRTVRGSHVLLAVGSVPNSDRLGLENATIARPTSRIFTPLAMSPASCHCRRSPRCRAARSPSTSWDFTRASTAISITTKRRRPCSPSPRSPTWAWPKRKHLPAGARSASPRCRSAPRRGRLSTTTRGAS